MTTNAPTPQAAVQAILDEAVQDNSESAVQVAAYLNGQRIVDAWAAPPDLHVDGATLFPYFSTGKGIAATAVHRLVERGVLSWDDTIAQHWPEFAANGKEGITLRHALNHTAGLPMMPDSADEVPDLSWSAMCAYLAAATPAHPPGAHRYYHGITYSWLIGETASRADGREFARIVSEEICQPLGITTHFFGLQDNFGVTVLDAQKALPPTDAPTAPESPSAAAANPPPDPIAQHAIPAWVCPLEDWINRDDVRRACIPASNGFGSARDVALHYAALVGPGVHGVRLLQEHTIDQATQWNQTVDGAIPGNGRWGLGYGLQGPDHNPGAVFGHGGYGGSTGFADRRYGLAVAVVKNRMGGTITGRIVDAIRTHANAPFPG